MIPIEAYGNYEQERLQRNEKALGFLAANAIDAKALYDDTRASVYGAGPDADPKQPTEVAAYEHVRSLASVFLVDSHASSDDIRSVEVALSKMDAAMQKRHDTVDEFRHAAVTTQNTDQV